MDSVRAKIEERLRAAFAEVMQKAGGLIDEALDDHFADMKMIFLRDRELKVSLVLGVEMNEAGQIEVELTTNYVKERVKQKTTARVTPGQMDLPGTGAVPVDVGRAEDFKPHPRPPVVRRLGPAPKLIGGGEPVETGDRNELDPFSAGNGMRYQDVSSRLARVKEMDAEQLRQVIALPGCQKSVVKAAEVRLRKLEKSAAKERAAKAKDEKCCDNCARNDPAEEVCGDEGCANLSEWRQKTCYNCGSREGERGCGLDPAANAEPCASWSRQSEVA